MAQMQRTSSASRAPHRRHELSSELAQGPRRPAPGPSVGARHVFLGKTLNGRGDMQSLLL